MLRRMAPSCIHLATFDRCSLIWMPGTEVAIGWNSPASFVPGFMSKVSFCDGPPTIHSTMHDYVLALVWAVWAARTLSQPDIDTAPAVVYFRRSRRDGFVVMRIPQWSAIESKLTAINKCPEDVVVSVPRLALPG